MFWRIGRRGFRLFRRLRSSNSAQSHQKETDLKPATPNFHLVILRESLARAPDPCPVSRDRACPELVEGVWGVGCGVWILTPTSDL